MCRCQRAQGAALPGRGVALPARGQGRGTWAVRDLAGVSPGRTLNHLLTPAARLLLTPEMGSLSELKVFIK